MATTDPGPTVSLVNEPSASSGGLNPQSVTTSKPSSPRAYVVLAALGWLAAGFSLWLQSIGPEPPQPAPTVQGGNRATPESKVSATQQSLATARSALAVTTRLRDEAAQALQEIRKKTAEVNKDLAKARGELDDVRRRIAARSSELSSISRAQDTARSRESQLKKQTDANSTATGAIQPSPVPPANDPPRPIERRASPIAGTSPADTAPPIATAKPSLDASVDPTTDADHQSRKRSLGEGSSAVIGPGAASRPSDFELRSGRISRTP